MLAWLVRDSADFFLASDVKFRWCFWVPAGVSSGLEAIEGMGVKEKLRGVVNGGWSMPVF